MRTIVMLVLGLFAFGMVGCASEGDDAASKPDNPPINRSLLPSAVIPPAEAAHHAEIAARFVAKSVKVEHTPSPVMTAQVNAKVIISPDEKFLFTISNQQIKRWSLPDGKLLNKIEIDPHPYCQAAEFPSGFRSGVLIDTLDRNIALQDGGKTLLYKMGESRNYRYDLATGVTTDEPRPYLLPNDAFGASDVYLHVQTQEEETWNAGERYSLQLRSLKDPKISIDRHAHPGDELQAWPSGVGRLPRVMVAGYNPAKNVAYLCRVNKDLDWVIDAVDLSPATQSNGWDGPRSILARAGQYANYSVPGKYSSATSAMVSADYRYAAIVQMDASWLPGNRVVVLDLTTGQELGAVGPEKMFATDITSFANGLLTVRTNIGSPRDGVVRVLTYQVPGLKQLESLEVNQVPGSTSESTTISAVSPTHRYVAVNSDFPGGVSSITVYDLQNGAVKMLNDDEPTRVFAEKTNATIKAAWARLPDVVAKEVARIKKAEDERAQIMREFTAMVRPPVYSAPPEPRLFRNSNNTNSNQSVTCSRCNGEGIILTHDYVGGFQREEKDDRGGYKTVRYYDESKWGTTPCPTCGGSGRIN